MESINATQAFLGDEPQWPAARIEMYDVQALWGGRRITVEGTRQVTVQIIQRGNQERRYEFVLEQDDWKRLLGVFVQNDFLTIQPKERMGIPDEGRPRIKLINAAGDSRAVEKWAGVADERFDAVYTALLQLEKVTQQLQPTYSGPSTLGA